MSDSPRIVFALEFEPQWSIDKRARDLEEQLRHAYPEKKAMWHSNFSWVWAFKEHFGCMYCTECDPCCMDLHHREGELKRFHIGDALGSRQLSNIKLEIACCDLLCANCHRKVHHRQRFALTPLTARRPTTWWRLHG